MEIDWEQVKIDAAISALQGILESGTIGEVLELVPSVVAKQSVRLANYLVQELKENKNNETLESEIKKILEHAIKKSR